MRTHGTFVEVYYAAKKSDKNRDDLPLNPVIRKIGSEWSLESGLHAEANSTVECTLDQFVDWWYELLRTNARPTKSLILEFEKHFRIPVED